MVYKNNTPFFWFSQLINGRPKPWKHFKIDGLMVNAYEILQKKHSEIKIRDKGIHRYLGFEGPIAMDSGGYLFMKKRVLNVAPKKILGLYEESKPDYGVVLDHPLRASLDSIEKRERQDRTLKNTQIMVESKKSENPQLIPVIHGHSKKSVKGYINKLRKIADFNVYGIGSLVPSVFNTKGVGGIYNVIDILSFVKKALPDKKMHVFGIGSTSTMHLMFYMGADSVDSSSWRRKAAYGAIQLPGVGDRYITLRKRQKKYADLSTEEKKLLDQCECPACGEHPLEELKQSFKLRALHNAWVFQKEVEKTRQFLQKNEYEEYVHKILGNSYFSNVLKYADKLINA